MDQLNKRYLPAEWAKQQFVQLTWPHKDTDWEPILDEVTDCFKNITREIIKRENLLIVCQNKSEVIHQLGDFDISNIEFIECPTNDTWARDHGGITVIEDSTPVIFDFTFNGWGLKFASNFDNCITKNLRNNNLINNHYSYRNCLDFVLEGGSIESDGEGTILTTAECLLSINRNNLSQLEIEDKLKNYFNCRRVLWLHHGYLAGDDTDSHIDTLVRFCTTDTITYVKCDDIEDEHYEELKKMEDELMTFTQLNEKPYTLIALPMADKVYDGNDRLPATYANFLIINGAVLYPTYDSPKDELARIQLKKAFPGREIVGINCISLIKQHGSLHCITMQYPL